MVVELEMSQQILPIDFVGSTYRVLLCPWVGDGVSFDDDKAG